MKRIMKYAMALLVGMMIANPATATAASDDANFKWPTKAVELVLPSSAGGDTDFNARTLGKYFRKITGEPLIVTNMTGGGGSIATSHVKDANADGSKALFCHTGPLIVNEVTGLVAYNFEAFEVACVAAVNESYIFAASQKSGIKSIQDLINKAKAAPGKVIYGTEFGGYSHLQGLRFQKNAGIELKIVDTGSTSEKTTSLLAGRIDLGAVPYAAAQDYQSSGEIALVAQGAAKRNPLIGTLPNFIEQGVDFTMDLPYVISFPKGTDPRIVKRMAEIIKQITEIPEYAVDIEKGYKQVPTYYDTQATITMLNDVRADFMQYKNLLQK